jgi:glycosyltransferase involved in cell wall biosynthesis
MPDKLTVLIPCKNERMNIRPCLESVRAVADEILVADSGSTDGTLEIVREMGGCRIVEREYIDSGNFKNWAIPQAAHEWVLIVDADERVTPELASEIKQTLAAAACDGYRILRRNHFFGHEIKHCGWNTDDALRLFRRDLGRYSDYGDHADVEVPTGKVGRLKSQFLHYTYWSMEQYLRKLDRYTTQWAEQRFARGCRVSYLELLLRPSLRFFHSYVIRLGFLDGAPGLVLCTLSSFYSFTKVAKLWALQAGLAQPDPECQSPGGREAVVQRLPLPGVTSPTVSDGRARRRTA